MTYNSAAVLPEMLAGIVDAPDIQIVIVDNGSRDASVSIVRQLAPHAELIESTTNLGFARAVNLAAQRSTGEVLLLLNPDACIDYRAVQACASILTSRKNVGVIAPHVQQPIGRLRTMEAGRDPTTWRMLVHFSGLSRLPLTWKVFEGTYLLDGRVRESRQVDWVSGACLFVRRDVWSRLNGLTERWFMYAEDIEFCLRARGSGFEILLEMSVTATHAIGQSSGDTDGVPTNSAWVINLFDLYRLRRQGSGLRLPLAWAWRTVTVLGLLSRALGYRIRGRRFPHSPTNWARESKKFVDHARALRAQSLRG